MDLPALSLVSRSERPAAEQSGAEAHALLVAEADHLDREGQSPFLLVQCLHAFDGGDHAEHAIVFSCVAHRVEVRAEHEAGEAGPAALVAADDVADGVEARLHSGFAHPAEHRFARGAVLTREKHSRQSTGQLGMPREAIAPLHDARGT
jgi:hypothetical protein